MKIDMHNYEEWMVAFIDNELNEKELLEFNSFLDTHPNLKDELSAYEKMQFQPESDLVYDAKGALYQPSGTSLLLKKFWPAAVLVLLGLTSIPFWKANNSQEDRLTPKTKTSVNTNPKIEAVQPEPENIAQTEPMQNIPSSSAVTQQHNEQVEKISSAPLSRVESKSTYQPKPTVALEVEEMVEEVTSPANTENHAEVPSAPQEPETAVEKQEEAVVQENRPEQIEPVALLAKKEVIQEAIEYQENTNALVVINEVTHPQLYKKLNQVVDRVEEKIEMVKKIKKEPITIRIGKTKILTINR